MTDYDELNVYLTDPLNADTDGDVLLDGAEVKLGTDPLLADSDTDGLSDGYELAQAGGSGCPSPLLPDSDGDGLNDGQEDSLGTSFCDADSDGDAVPDGAEHNIYLTDPLNPDTDEDGLMDGTEIEIGAGTDCPNPLVADSDGDTILDGVEVELACDPCNPDTDNDGINDAVDPLPKTPGVTTGFFEDLTRETAEDIEILNLDLFNGQNDNANAGRRNALVNRTQAAANAIAEGDLQTARDELVSLLEKIDGEIPPPDWMKDSPEKAELAELILLLISLTEYSP